MTSYLDLIPLFPEMTLQHIRDEMDAVANEAADPENPVDTREGSLFWWGTQPLAVGLARAYENMNEVVAASKISTTWGPYLDAHADSFAVTRKEATRASGEVTIVGVPGTLIGTGIQVGPEQEDPDIEAPIYQTTDSGVIDGTGEITVGIEAMQPGPEHNIGAGAITLVHSPVAGPAGEPLTSITNTDPVVGGADVEIDVDLRERLQLQFAGRGSGTQTDYKRWALATAGVGRVQVVPAWNGPGTVQVIISDPDGNPVSAAIIDALQAELDPEPGQGAGVAPIGHTVTVATVALLGIDVGATIVFEPGFSLTGAGGGVALQGEIVDALAGYINQLDPGEDVIYEHVKSTFFTVPGVQDISNVTVEGGVANVVVGTNPPQVARLSVVTLA